MQIKPKAIFIDINGAKYKIKEVFPEINSFSYWFKDVDESTYTYKGIKDTVLLENELKKKTIVPYGKASKVLYGQSNKN